jgi:Immunity protein Imm1
VPYLLWEGNRAEVDSLELLDAEIDHLTDEACKGMPFSVQVCLDYGTAMLIVVGRPESHLEFTSPTNQPLMVGCVGPCDDDELIEFSHGGQHSELPRRFWVPTSEAREALRTFFRTGERPSNIRWN